LFFTTHVGATHCVQNPTDEMEAMAGNSILDFETLFSDFQELLNGSGLIGGMWCSVGNMRRYKAKGQYEAFCGNMRHCEGSGGYEVFPSASSFRHEAGGEKEASSPAVTPRSSSAVSFITLIARSYHIHRTQSCRVCWSLMRGVVHVVALCTRAANFSSPSERLHLSHIRIFHSGYATLTLSLFLSFFLSHTTLCGGKLPHIRISKDLR